MYRRLFRELNAEVSSISGLPIADQKMRFVQSVSQQSLRALDDDPTRPQFVLVALQTPMFTHRLELDPPHVDRRHDVLLLGFAALDGDFGPFRLSVCGYTHASLWYTHASLCAPDGMSRGSWRSAVGERCPLFASLAYRSYPLEIYHESPRSNSIWVVYAMLSTHASALFHNKTIVVDVPGCRWMFDDPFVDCVDLDGGNNTDEDEEDAEVVATLPEVRLDNDYRMPIDVMYARARRRADVLREELMAKTWSPSRMRRWCLEHDDAFFDGTPS